jgi:hypothetical protein
MTTSTVRAERSLSLQLDTIKKGRPMKPPCPLTHPHGEALLGVVGLAMVRLPGIMPLIRGVSQSARTFF